MNKSPNIGFTVAKGEDGWVAEGSHKGIHLTIFPKYKEGNAYEVHITGETDKGEPDWRKEYNSTSVELNDIDDVREATHLYMTRLQAGIKPEDMFVDIEEANERMIEELCEGLRKKR